MTSYDQLIRMQDLVHMLGMQHSFVAPTHSLMLMFIAMHCEQGPSTFASGWSSRLSWIKMPGPKPRKSRLISQSNSDIFRHFELNMPNISSTIRHPEPKADQKFYEEVLDVQASQTWYYVVLLYMVLPCTTFLSNITSISTQYASSHLSFKTIK